MEIIMPVFLCSGFLFFLGMTGAVAFGKRERVARFFFLTILSEGASMVIAVVMTFLNL